MEHGIILSTDHQAIQERKLDSPDGLHQSQLARAVEQATRALLSLQHPDGYWCFELEADCTIPAEYILMMHYLGNVDQQLEQKLASTYAPRQNKDGGWPLYYRGPAEISCSVKAYYALKLAGDSPDLPHMAKAPGDHSATGRSLSGQRVYPNRTCNF